MDEIDLDAKLTDCFFFDVASNVQTAGAILCARYPRAMCFHGGEHVLSLFFSDLSKLKPIQVRSIFFAVFFLFQYLTFCSSLFSSAADYTMFLGPVPVMEFMPSSLFKPLPSIMVKIGLLHGAGSRFATWFYAMHRALRMKPPFKATIHNPSFASLSKNDCVAAAIVDIEDEVFWKAIYCFLRAVFPALKALQYCDSNIPAMDKVYFLVK